MEGVEERENRYKEEGHNEDEFDTENKDGDSFFLIISKTVKQRESDCVRDNTDKIVEDGDNTEHATDITNYDKQDETFFNDDKFSYMGASDIIFEHKHYKYE